MKIKVCTIFFTLLLALGCSKSDDTVEPDKPIQKDPPKEEPAIEVLTGKFIDGEVGGLTFTTATQSGITNEKGEFTYVSGEEVTFKVGGIILGKVLGQELVSPVTLAQEIDADATIASPMAKNIAAFLQTLDEDQNHDNGIEITADVVSAIGVQSLDFSGSISSSLADMVINISKQTGKMFNIVYPEQAAENMANALDMEYTPVPNLSLSQLLPLLQSLYAAQIPPSAVYKNTMDENGLLVSTAITLRYSGRVVRELQYQNHNEKGLPTTILKTEVGPGLITSSWSYPITEKTEVQELVYNGMDLVERINIIDPNQTVEHYYVITERNDLNQAVVFNETIRENLNIYVSEKQFTHIYETGMLITEELKSTYTSNDELNQYSSLSEYENTTTFAYDAQLNFSTLDSEYSNNFTSQYQNEDPYVSSSSSKQHTDFVYTPENTLKERKLTGQITSNDISQTLEQVYLFDANELLTESRYSNSFGNESISLYNEGFQISYESYFEGLLDVRVTYNVDGSFEETEYVYYENGELDYSYKQTWMLMPAGYYDIVKTEYFDDQGNITETTDSEFYEDGGIYTTTSYDENGEIIWKDYYNEDGYWVKEEYYENGLLDYTYIFEYDGNGLRTKAEGYNAQNVLESIYQYNEFGGYSSIEFFDNGVLTESLVYAYDDLGTLTQVETFDANGNLVYFDKYDQYGYLEYYDFYEDGILILRSYFNTLNQNTRTEYYEQGEISYYYIFAYDTNGIIITVEGYYGTNVLFSIEYYENGDLVRIDYYDENGNIIDSYDPSGKSMSQLVNTASKYNAKAKTINTIRNQVAKHNKMIKLRSAKILHDKHEGTTVKKIVKSKYAVKDKARL
ncbi:Antitoxin component YwqK of the YwqJK toxin-antitoxin module [Maribacter sedimenticola]|uniref:Antitoxin component YwqK of the YwqJK toxin-antitoxin module n=1 Tax=Maribacter sedimenticola TaxID=228956 RepID=A0ABY1SCQ5_9FLAO|nr:hypothetical protein [Maribacter sedimenticola]SNR26824.1 Antitoxin component YwqK of the YwqJK toxin-antitoxin module [Maribacter sedimenticola]